MCTVGLTNDTGNTSPLLASLLSVTIFGQLISQALSQTLDMRCSCSPSVCEWGLGDITSRVPDRYRRSRAQHGSLFQSSAKCSRLHSLPFLSTMSKRARSPSPPSMSKMGRTTHPFAPRKIATAEAAGAAQANPPFLRLLADMRNVVQNPQPGKSIIYWMRMGDLRSKLAQRM